MNVRITATLLLVVLAGCSEDRTVTGPDPEVAPRANLDALAAPTTQYADGYAWASNPTGASYTPVAAYSFNRSGGAITITRQGIGTYTVRFAGLSVVLGTKSTVHVTGYGTTNTYCKSANQKLLSDVVHIKCFDAASGRPSDAFYAVHVTKRYGDLAFAYASLPTGNDYVPPGSASYNPAGAIRVFRSGVGAYRVKFTGLGSRLSVNGGHAQAMALGTGAQHCKILRWTGTPDLDVYVSCFSRFGEPKDVKFNVLLVTPNPALAYAWANQPTSSSYAPDPKYRSNPSGGPVTIVRAGVGRYTVSWSGLSLLGGGDVQVTAYGAGNIVCKVERWGVPDALVRCFNPATNVLVDSYFDVMFFS